MLAFPSYNYEGYFKLEQVVELKSAYYLIRHTLVCTRSYTYNTLIVSCFYIDDLHCKTVQSGRQKCRNLCAVRASHNVPSDSITSTVNNLLTVPDPFYFQESMLDGDVCNVD